MRATRMLAALLAAHPAGAGAIGATKNSPPLLNSEVDPGIRTVMLNTEDMASWVR